MYIILALLSNFISIQTTIYQNILLLYNYNAMFKTFLIQVSVCLKKYIYI